MSSHASNLNSHFDRVSVAKKLPKAFLDRLRAVKGKRSRAVVDHILEHGFISTEDLKDTYGYDHPPRAVRDVREQGIPIETFSTVGKHGRKIAAYRFADPAGIRSARHAGRSVLSKKLKAGLIERYGSQCAICSSKYESRYLQIDHCVPYEVAGDVQGESDASGFMLICGSCNRAKSWSCEHCPNWTTDHDPSVCRTCYWASPEKYAHIALRVVRRLDVVWMEHDVPDYDKLAEMSQNANQELPKFVKDILRKHLDT
jgi:hypothetical protein